MTDRTRVISLDEKMAKPKTATLPRRPDHYKTYAALSAEIVPGVFVDAEGLSIVDDEGEIVCWTADEWREDPAAVTAAITAAVLAAARGAAAVRQQLAGKVTVLAALIKDTKQHVSAHYRPDPSPRRRRRAKPTG